MSYATAKAELDALPPDADKLAHAAATVYAWRDRYASYRTFDAMFGKVKTDFLEAFVKSQSLRYHGYMSTPGDEAGTGGGVNLKEPQVQQLIMALPYLPSSPWTADEVGQILDLARSPAGPRYAVEWKIQAFDATTLARLPLLDAHEFLTAVVDSLSEVIAFKPEAATVLAGIVVTETHRARLVQYVQAFKSLIDDGDPAAAAYVATPAAAWAFAKQGGV